MDISALVMLVIVIVGVILLFNFIKSIFKILLLVAVAAVILFFVSKYTGFAIW